MKKLNLYTIVGILFVILLGTLWHFVYEWSGNNFIVGLFFPVNESTWEHMKLYFFPMVLYALFMNRLLKGEYPCVGSALLGGILLGTFLIPVLFYTYSGILGKNLMFFDIATFVLSVLFGFLCVYQLTLSCRLFALKWLFRLLVLALAMCFLVFSYMPPEIGLFMPPV